LSIEFEVSDVVPGSPDEIYSAWLDSNQHTRMTGSPARASNTVGGTFEAWDGYIQGTNLELEFPGRILQLWRTSEFDETDPDSRLQVIFEAAEGGTKITIRHTELPDHGMQYRQGWVDAYFTPMKDYFKE
jgi:activator of HSP90 ATPase